MLSFSSTGIHCVCITLVNTIYVTYDMIGPSGVVWLWGAMASQVPSLFNLMLNTQTLFSNLQKILRTNPLLLPPFYYHLEVFIHLRPRISLGCWHVTEASSSVNAIPKISSGPTLRLNRNFILIEMDEKIQCQHTPNRFQQRCFINSLRICHDWEIFHLR